MDAWKTLLEIVGTLSEERAYRGLTAVRFKDLQDLLGTDIDPNGGVKDMSHDFDPSIWTGWQPKVATALAAAATDSKRDVPTVGSPQGGTVMKRSYGGRVFYQSGNQRPHSNDMVGSAMDRYDVLMIGDVGERLNKKGRIVGTGTLTRVAYAPSMGSFEERKGRLEALLAGQKIQLPQRPQPHQPGLTPDEEERIAAQKTAAAQRDAAARKDAGDDRGVQGDRGGSSSNRDFADKMAKHSANYQPSGASAYRDDSKGSGLFGDEPRPAPKGPQVSYVRRRR